MDAFQFHTGFEITEKRTGKGEKLFEMDCPFCGKEGHFHFFEDTRFGCKVCSVKGNVYEFIHLIYDQCLQDLGQLPKQRSLPERALSGIKFNRLTESFVLPTYKMGKMNNLYKTGPGLRWMGTPGLTTTLYNWDEASEQEVWMCEGQWDRCAATAIIGNNHPITPIAIPGAASFKESWCGAFNGKDVVLIFDNDEAGVKGLEHSLKVFEESAQKPRSLKYVCWPDKTPDGYDLRDFYIENGRRSYVALQDLIKDVDAPQSIRITTPSILEDFTCDSYDKALDAFEKAFHTTSDMRAALACTMASIYSINVKGEQLWFKIIGPPGCGKTRIAKAVSGSDHVVSKSTFTGLFSGWTDNSEDDPGLIPLISGRTMIVKDADALLRQPNIEKIMSELRDFYDKDSSVQYKNRRSYEYRDIKSTIIICGTQVLRRADQSFLGERFLSVEMDVTAVDQEAISQKMMERSMEVAMGVTKDPETQIMSSMKGWINHLRERKLDCVISTEFQQNLIRLCTLTALMRTAVDRDFKRKLMSPAVPELPTRLIGQMITATLSLSAVFGDNSPDTKVFSIIQKILRDTINPRSNRFKICDALMEHPNIDAFELMEALNMPKTTLNEELEDLQELGFLHISQRASDSPGRRRHIFRLDDRIATPMRDLL
jgi:predicted transcriptional regulator/energy-coupling factor transporter ATP-binding protein EcfA2